MRCSKCGGENPSGKRFCGDCGAPLTVPLPRSGPDIETSNQQRIAAAMPEPEEQGLSVRAGTETPSDGERKVVTTLFADIKGSMELMENLDPEEARAIIDPASRLMAAAVRRYEGYLVQSTGDGIFALRRASRPRGSSAARPLCGVVDAGRDATLRRALTRRRVCRAAGPGRRQHRRGGRPFTADRQYTCRIHADGHSTGLAARLQTLANPGAVVISEHVAKLVEGYFQLKSLGPVRVKGVNDLVVLFEVLGLGPLRTKFQVAACRGLTRFVGRQAEIEHLRRALERAQTGHGQIVGVMGEPGLGKSRLLHEFRLTTQGWLVLEAYSVSYGKASPYLPIIELLKAYFEISLEDDGHRRRDKVVGKVLALDRSLDDTLPYFFALLGIEDQPSNLDQMDPQIRRRRTFDALKKLLLRESLNQPLILIFEDLHWIDRETQGFLDLLSDSIASGRILLLANYRPEYRHEWATKSYYTELHLTPLSRKEAEDLLVALLGTASSLSTLRQLILEKSEGTPFFIEELVQTLCEEGVLSFDPAAGAKHSLPISATLHIPTTIQGLLAARIDRLPAEEKALLQHLAVIGREFPIGLVHRVVRQPEEQLRRLLSSLQSKDFVYEQPALAGPKYIFKHALTQEVAYKSLLVEQRRVLHEETAEAIEALFHSRLEDHYSELAHHYTRSRNTRKAIEYLQLAGRQAVQRSANTEAIH
jgi:class 3 adenylate cyclase